MSYWKGKRAIVTGGSAGFGRVLAELLVNRGARVAIVARGQEALDRTVSELSEGGGDIQAVQADVTNGEDVTRIAQWVNDGWGGLDALFLNAGKSTRGQVSTTPIDEFRSMWEVNFLSCVRFAQMLIDPLLESGGHFVMIGSLAGKLAPRFLGAYPSSKFPLTALAQQLRLEFADRGLHVLLVCPGPIQAEGFENRYEEISTNLPQEAVRPGGGAKVKALDPCYLAEKTLKACERRKAELILPRKVRPLIMLSFIAPRLADRILKSKTAS